MWSGPRHACHSPPTSVVMVTTMKGDYANGSKISSTNVGDLQSLSWRCNDQGGRKPRTPDPLRCRRSRYSNELAIADKILDLAGARSKKERGIAKHTLRIEDRLDRSRLSARNSSPCCFSTAVRANNTANGCAVSIVKRNFDLSWCSEACAEVLTGYGTAGRNRNTSILRFKLDNARC